MHILFDYGHGGKEPGATYKGRHEANDVLRIGQAVAKRLRAAGLQIDAYNKYNSVFTTASRNRKKEKVRLFYILSPQCI